LLWLVPSPPLAACTSELYSPSGTFAPASSVPYHLWVYVPAASATLSWIVRTTVPSRLRICQVTVAGRASVNERTEWVASRSPSCG
jgi:hypothetical protein